MAQTPPLASLSILAKFVARTDERSLSSCTAADTLDWETGVVMLHCKKLYHLVRPLKTKVAAKPQAYNADISEASAYIKAAKRTFGYLMCQHESCPHVPKSPIRPGAKQVLRAPRSCENSRLP